MTLSIMTLSIRIECCYAECHNVECRFAKWCYGECRYAKCRYDECHSAEQCYKDFTDVIYRRNKTN